jgi:hypothetical protein
LGLALCTSGCPLVLAGAAAGSAAGATVSAREGQEKAYSPLTYVGTVLADVVYVPAKVGFAGVGALTSGAAYLITLGDADVSSSIWNSSVNGNYVLTPGMIDGDTPIHFTGE